MFYIRHTADDSYWCEGLGRRWSFWTRQITSARSFPTEAAAVSAAERDCYANSTDLRIVEVIDPGSKAASARCAADICRGIVNRLTDGAAAYVAEAAIAWDQARREAARLRGLRASFKCDHELDAEYDDDGRLTAEADPACWRHMWQDQLGRDCRPPMGDWCEPCLKRHVAHAAYTKAVAKRQGLMRGLQRRALTAWESTQEVSACR